jgi:cell shape-determining protein MreC
MIEYSRSYHETYVLKSALEETKADANKIDEFAKEQMRKYGV